MLFLRKLHKWLSLIVGLQMLLWTVSGLMFAWLDHHQVSAEHSVRASDPAVLSASMPLDEPATWMDERASGEVFEVRLAPLLDRWVWRIEGRDRVELRGAEDGKPLEIDEPLVRRLALSRYVGDGQLESVALQPTSTLEARDSGPIWRAQFNDSGHTTLYFAADDGRLVTVRNNTWRLFDFFWMLHTMDYQGRDNFNNPVVITVGTAALWLSLSGFLLLFRSFRLQDFEFIRGWRHGRPALRVHPRPDANTTD